MAGGVVVFVAALVIITFSGAEKALEKQEEALEKQETELRAQIEAQMEQIQGMEQQLQDAFQQLEDEVVHQTGFDSEKGNYVILYHETNGAFTHYEGCEEILVAEGEYVAREQKIATVGQSGRSTGHHLHFAVQENGEYIEPVFSE